MFRSAGIGAGVGALKSTPCLFSLFFKPIRTARKPRTRHPTLVRRERESCINKIRKFYENLLNKKIYPQVILFPDFFVCELLSRRLTTLPSTSVLVAFRTNFEKQLARKVKIQEARPKPESKWRDEASVATHRLRWGLHARRPKRARWRSRACLSSLFLFSFGV